MGPHPWHSQCSAPCQPCNHRKQYLAPHFALSGETPVHILIQSRLGTVLVPDLVRAANQPLPRGYGRPPETTAVDFTGVLSAHVQLWLTSTVSLA